MQSKLLVRLSAVILAVCLMITSVSTVQMVKVYADEGVSELSVDEAQDQSEAEATSEFTEEESAPQQEETPEEPEESEEPEEPEEPVPDVEPHEDQPDPFDYNLTCYTPIINFGTAEYGDIVYAKQFNIVNIGKTRFPITWEEIDQYTAFDCGLITPNEYMDPGDTVTFSVSPREGLKPGTYSARYTFFSANDYRRNHYTIVDVTVTIKDEAPFVSSVDISPGTVTIPTGKSFKFDVYVTGGYDFDSSVIWSLTGNESVSTYIDSDGVLTVGDAETATSFAVIATSRQDPSIADRAIVTVSSVDHIVSVKADPAEGGAVAGGGAIRSGGSCSLSASPNNNFTFSGWYEGNNLIASEQKIVLNNITEDRKLVAKFTRKTCMVKTSVNDADAGTVTKSASIAYGGKMTLTAKAKSGYRFVSFVENKKTISTSESLELNNITSDRNITAVFERITCKVSVFVNPQDTGKTVGGGNYYKGTDVELKATAYDGYEFTGWTVNGQVVSRDRKYVIEEIKNDFNITANFMKKEAVKHKMTSGIATEGGSITPSGESIVVDGGSITYNIVPQNDYKISAVTVDGKNIGAVASYTFNNIKAPHKIVASFEKKPLEPAKANGSAVAGTKKQEEKTTQSKTEYNEKTAAQGAVPEQNKIDEKAPNEVELLEEEEYSEDVVVAAPEEALVADASNSVAPSIMAKHNLDEETLRVLINDDAVGPMLKEAYEEGTLLITVNNTYAASQQESADLTYHSEPTLLNFEDVIAESLSQEEKVSVLTGTPIAFNVDIYENSASIDSATKKVMASKVGYKPISYFDFVILKTSNGTTSIINKTSSELEVVVPIPEQYIKKNKKFYIIRNHNGVVDVLDNIGDSDELITFRTDRFSQYAIAYQAVSVNRLLIQYAIIAFASLILAILCCVNLVRFKRKMRRKH